MEGADRVEPGSAGATRDPGGLEHSLKSYRAVPRRQRVQAGVLQPLGERLRRAPRTAASGARRRRRAPRTPRRASRRSAAAREPAAPIAGRQRRQRGHRPQLEPRARAREPGRWRSPMRSPVKCPGPTPDRDRVEVAEPHAGALEQPRAIAGISSRACAGGASEALGAGAPRSASRRRAARRRPWRRWTVSKPSERSRAPRSAAGRRRRCSSRTRAATRSQRLGSATLRPLDEGDPLGRQVVVQQRGILPRERLEPVEVEVGHLHVAAP